MARGMRGSGAEKVSHHLRSALGKAWEQTCPRDGRCFRCCIHLQESLDSLMQADSIDDLNARVDMLKKGC
eukprot:1667126-Amphidinium_carterae.1